MAQYENEIECPTPAAMRALAAIEHKRVKCKYIRVLIELIRESAESGRNELLFSERWMIFDPLRECDDNHEILYCEDMMESLARYFRDRHYTVETKREENFFFIYKISYKN